MRTKASVFKELKAENKAAMQAAIIEASNFPVRFVESRPQRIVAKCKDYLTKNCKFHVSCSPRAGEWRVCDSSNHVFEHNCTNVNTGALVPPTRRRVKASIAVAGVEQKLGAQYVLPTGLKAMRTVAQTVNASMSLDLSPQSFARLGAQRSSSDLTGLLLQFASLPNLVKQLSEADPTGVYVLEKEETEWSKHSFKSLFVAFGAMVRMQSVSKNLIGCPAYDACFVKTEVSGRIIFAVHSNPNGESDILAVGLSNRETAEAMGGFMKNFRIAYPSVKAILNDQGSGMLSENVKAETIGVTDAMRLTAERLGVECVQQIYVSLCAKHYADKLSGDEKKYSESVHVLARCRTKESVDSVLKQIKKDCPSLAAKLESDVENLALSFKLDQQISSFGVITNSAVEGMNSARDGERFGGPVKLISGVLNYCTRSFEDRIKHARSWMAEKHVLVPKAAKMLGESLKKATAAGRYNLVKWSFSVDWKGKEIGDFKFEGQVKKTGERKAEYVLLEKKNGEMVAKTCVCRYSDDHRMLCPRLLFLLEMGKLRVIEQHKDRCHEIWKYFSHLNPDFLDERYLVSTYEKLHIENAFPVIPENYITNGKSTSMARLKELFFVHDDQGMFVRRLPLYIGDSNARAEYETQKKKQKDVLKNGFGRQKSWYEQSKKFQTRNMDSSQKNVVREEEMEVGDEVAEDGFLDVAGRLRNIGMALDDFELSEGQKEAYKGEQKEDSNPKRCKQCGSVGHNIRGCRSRTKGKLYEDLKMLERVVEGEGFEEEEPEFVAIERLSHFDVMAPSCKSFSGDLNSMTTEDLCVFLQRDLKVSEILLLEEIRSSSIDGEALCCMTREEVSNYLPEGVIVKLRKRFGVFYLDKVDKEEVQRNKDTKEDVKKTEVVGAFGLDDVECEGEGKEEFKKEESEENRDGDEGKEEFKKEESEENRDGDRFDEWFAKPISASPALVEFDSLFDFGGSNGQEFFDFELDVSQKEEEEQDEKTQHSQHSQPTFPFPTPPSKRRADKELDPDVKSLIYDGLKNEEFSSIACLAETVERKSGTKKLKGKMTQYAREIGKYNTKNRKWVLHDGESVGESEEKAKKEKGIWNPSQNSKNEESKNEEIKKEKRSKKRFLEDDSEDSQKEDVSNKRSGQKKSVALLTEENHGNRCIWDEKIQAEAEKLVMVECARNSSTRGGVRDDCRAEENVKLLIEEVKKANPNNQEYVKQVIFEIENRLDNIVNDQGMDMLRGSGYLYNDFGGDRFRQMLEKIRIEESDVESVSKAGNWVTSSVVLRICCLLNLSLLKENKKGVVIDVLTCEQHMMNASRQSMTNDPRNSTLIQMFRQGLKWAAFIMEQEAHTFLLPFHNGTNHWFLVILSLESLGHFRIEVWDSLNKMGFLDETSVQAKQAIAFANGCFFHLMHQFKVKVVIMILCAIKFQKNEACAFHSIPKDVVRLILRFVLERKFVYSLSTCWPIVPKQQNTDCGVFMLAFIEAFLQGYRPEGGKGFVKENNLNDVVKEKKIGTFRRKFARLVNDKDIKTYKYHF